MLFIFFQCVFSCTREVLENDRSIENCSSDLTEINLSENKESIHHNTSIIQPHSTINIDHDECENQKSSHEIKTETIYLPEQRICNETDDKPQKNCDISNILRMFCGTKWSYCVLEIFTLKIMPCVVIFMIIFYFLQDIEWL